MHKLKLRTSSGYALAIAAFALSLYSAGAYAYVGPGLGLGVLGSLFGAITAFFLAIVGLIWYPFKRLFRKIKSKRSQAKPSTDTAAADKDHETERPTE